MKYLAAIVLLTVLSGTVQAQSTFGWSEFYAQQQTFELQRLNNQLYQMNQRQVRNRTDRIYSRGALPLHSWRTSNNYRRPTYYRRTYNTWRPTYGGWGWTNGGF